MAASIKVTFDMSQVKRMLGHQRRQAPFILTTLINSLLKDSQQAAIQETTRRFTIRRPVFLKMSFKVTKFAKKGSLSGWLEVANLPGRSSRDILAKHEKGGTKRPRGRNLAIPLDSFTPRSRVIPKAKRPGNLKRTFKVRSRKGQDLLIQRTGKGRNSKTRVAYLLEPTARIHPRLDFILTAGSAVTRNLDKRFREAWDKALKTAR